MRKSWIIIAVVVVLAIAGGIVWMVMGNKQADTSTSSTATSTSDSGATEDELTAGTSQSEVVTVTMKNTQFSPKTLTVKRGTTVKWVNEDSVRHNVVAANENDRSGLPANNELFGKGGIYQFTFDTIGTFDYKCTPHPFMTGTIEVTE